MRKRRTAVVTLAGLSVLTGCQTPSAGQGPAKEASIETLQKATSMANGNLAWETVHVSEVQRDAKSVKWLATTRSLRLRCTAQSDGSGSYCEREGPPTL
jgi:uncharacterized protein YggE